MNVFYPILHTLYEEEKRMKKTLLIVFVILFSLTLVSCQREAQEDVNGVDEGEVSTEQTPPAEEKSEDTVKRLEFSLPDDFSDEPYREAELIPIEDFVWGDYMPFVKYSMKSYDDSLPSHAFLGEGIESLEEGHRAFEKLNDLYLTEYPIPEEGDYVGLYSFSEEWVSDYLFRSNIVKISEDLKNFQIWRVVDWGKDSRRGELDTYENGVLTNTEVFGNEYQNGYRWYYYEEDYEKSNLSGISVKEEWDHKNERIFKYFVEDNGKLKYEVTFDIPRTYPQWYGVLLDNIVNPTTLLVTFLHHGEAVQGDNLNPYRDNGINRNTYVLDLEKGTLEKVANYLAHPCLSPDGEYLIYSSFPDRNASANPPDNYAYRMSKGFFVKRISTGETTFYPLAADWDTSHATLGWISKSAYEEAVK